MYNVFEIEWTGPYTNPDETNQVNILYLITGSLKKGRHTNKIRYIGKTKNTTVGRFNNKHKFWNVFEKGREFWIGRIKGSNSAGNDGSAISKAEWLLVHYLSNYCSGRAIELMNDKLKNEPKYKNAGVVNRWFKKDGDEYVNMVFPFHQFPDIILWDKTRGHVISSNRAKIDRDDEKNAK